MIQIIKVNINRYEPKRIGWKYNEKNGLLIAWNTTLHENILEKKGLFCNDMIIEFDEKCRITMYRINSNMGLDKLDVNELN